MTDQSIKGVARTSQTGFTLIELLIGITIGLFIIGAALLVFQSVTGIGRQISEVAQLRQQGAHAFRVIGKQLREAGAVLPEQVGAGEGYEGLGKYKFKGAYTWLGGTPISSWTPPHGTDYLHVARQVVGSNPSTDYSGLLLNCLGQQVKEGIGTADTRRNAFYVNAQNELMCFTGSNANGQPIIGNVHAFKVLYRVKPSANNLTQKRFVEASSVTDWRLVDAVEVCLDLIGTTRNPTATPNGGGVLVDTKYVNCEGQSVDRDNRLHVVQKNLFTVYTGQR